MRARDALQAQRLDLAKQKPRAKSDENVISEISRLEATMTVLRDDLVSPFASLPYSCPIVSDKLLDRRRANSVSQA